MTTFVSLIYILSNLQNNIDQCTLKEVIISPILFLLNKNNETWTNGQLDIEDIENERS